MSSIRFLMPVILLLLATPANASQRDCRVDPELRREAVALVLDRTTVLDTAAKERWRRGVAKLLADPSVRGELRVLEVRESATSLTTLKTACIDRLGYPEAAKPDGLAGGWKSIARWWSGNDGGADVRARRLVESQSARRRLAADLRKQVDADNPTRSESEIAQSIIATLQTNCNGVTRCTLLVFSDFMDTTAKRAVGSRDPRAAGARRARELLKEYAPNLSRSTLKVRAWGFGRDDARAGAPLDDRRRTQLRAYWTAFFDTLRGAARDGSVEFADFI